MNISRIALVLGLATAVGGSVVLLPTRERPVAQAATTSLGVDQLAKNPQAYTDQVVTFEGVVAELLPEQRRFTVIDRREYQSCKVVTCSQYQVPIAFAGDLPPATQAVSVTGRLVQPEPGRFLLEASRVAKLP